MRKHLHVIRRQAIPILALISLTACAVQRYQPVPLVPSVTSSRFQSRSLADPGLRTFEQKYFGHTLSPWPPQRWDLPALSVAALYFNPAMDVARARLATAEGAEVTAGQRPNPTINFTPGIPSPYLLASDFLFPIESAGKRARRIDIAHDLDKAAQFDLADAAWTIVMGVRLALLNDLVSKQNLALLRSQEKAGADRVAIAEQQAAAGETTRLMANLERISLSKTEVAIRAAEGQVADAQAALAAEVGIPVEAFHGVQFEWPEMTAPPSSESLLPAAIQRDAVVNRLDVRRALAQYAAAEAALQLEIAKQYPNFNIGPGYTYEERNSYFTLGFSITLPVFNRNQGPIAEAEGRRKEAAAAFLQTQTQVIEKSDRALAAYKAALNEMIQAQSLHHLQEVRVEAIRQAIRAGSDDRLSLDGAQIQLSVLAGAKLNALASVQRALGDLENAVQRPLAPGDVLPSPDINGNALRTKGALFSSPRDRR